MAATLGAFVTCSDIIEKRLLTWERPFNGRYIARKRDTQARSPAQQKHSMKMSAKIAFAEFRYASDTSE
jgi:hypothetical protein